MGWFIRLFYKYIWILNKRLKTRKSVQTISNFKKIIDNNKIYLI